MNPSNNPDLCSEELCKLVRFATMVDRLAAEREMTFDEALSYLETAAREKPEFYTDPVTRKVVRKERDWSFVPTGKEPPPPVGL